jgi:hypothetical protein
MDPIPQEVNNMLNLQIFSLHASLKKEWVSWQGKLPSFSIVSRKVYLSNNTDREIREDFLKAQLQHGRIMVSA